MRKAYVDYVSEKIKNICATSQAEHKAVFAVDKCSGMSELTLIDITENSYTLYHCKINRNTEPSKIKIDFISEDISHSFSRMLSTEITDRYTREWNKLFVEKNGKLYYDDYCDRYLCPESLLADIRNEFEVIKNKVRTDVVAVCSDYIQFKPFRYVLEQTFHNHIIIDAESGVSLNGRIDIDMTLQKTKVGIGNLGCNLIRAIKLNEPIYVPLCEETLSSAFFEEITWRDIVDHAPVAAEIEGVGMAVITLRFSIDAYQNVFVSVKELSRNTFRIIWLHKSDVGGNVPDSLRTTDIVSAIPEQRTERADSITSKPVGGGKPSRKPLDTNKLADEGKI